jgi:hypothetical protein
VMGHAIERHGPGQTARGASGKRQRRAARGASAKPPLLGIMDTKHSRPTSPGHDLAQRSSDCAEDVPVCVPDRVCLTGRTGPGKVSTMTVDHESKQRVVGAAARHATTLVPRAALSPAPGMIAEYLQQDSVTCAPIRARLRLCVSQLVEHRLLHHRELADTDCRCCRRRGTFESVQHVFFECSAFVAARSAARDALRAVALDLDIAAIAGASNSAHSLAVLRATSPLLSAVRLRLRL